MKGYKEQNMSQGMKRWLTRDEYKSWKAWLIKGTKRKVKRSKEEKRRRNEFRHQEREEAEKRCTKYLEEFWRNFNAAKNCDERLELMKAASHPGWPRVSDSLHQHLRSKFLKRKYPEALYQEECLVCCAEYARERHHIVPLCYGGSNHISNLFRIGYKCHDAIHP